MQEHHIDVQHVDTRDGRAQRDLDQARSIPHENLSQHQGSSSEYNDPEHLPPHWTESTSSWARIGRTGNKRRNKAPLRLNWGRISISLQTIQVAWKKPNLTILDRLPCERNSTTLARVFRIQRGCHLRSAGGCNQGHQAGVASRLSLPTFSRESSDLRRLTRQSTTRIITNCCEDEPQEKSQSQREAVLSCCPCFSFSLCQDNQGDSRNLRYYMVPGRSTVVYYEG
ncbi:MAG: hypothetical protein J3Q66DRAFT_81723 [Benniella sp.]|nr:MAG: hypothetical protein J3Q66DRAFT_81723 [Benniella sp.]